MAVHSTFLSLVTLTFVENCLFCLFGAPLEMTALEFLKDLLRRKSTQLGLYWSVTVSTDSKALGYKVGLTDALEIACTLKYTMITVHK